MKVYEVKCGGRTPTEASVSYGKQYAESMKEAIRFTRMDLFAAGVKISDEGWYAVELVNG